MTVIIIQGFKDSNKLFKRYFKTPVFILGENQSRAGSRAAKVVKFTLLKIYAVVLPFSMVR